MARESRVLETCARLKDRVARIATVTDQTRIVKGRDESALRLLRGFEGEHLGVGRAGRLTALIIEGRTGRRGVNEDSVRFFCGTGSPRSAEAKHRGQDEAPDEYPAESPSST